MAETLASGDLAAAGDDPGATGVPPRRRRSGLRIALLVVASVIVLIGAVAAGFSLYLNALPG